MTEYSLSPIIVPMAVNLCNASEVDINCTRGKVK
jgi:hypothetical protein